MVKIVYTTLSDIKDARKLAHGLVEEQLVACVNIIPNVESVYSWKGEIKEDSECILICKTVDENVKKTIKKIEKLHPYELPAIVVIPIVGGLKNYLEYINNQTA